MVKRTSFARLVIVAIVAKGQLLRKQLAVAENVTPATGSSSAATTARLRDRWFGRKSPAAPAIYRNARPHLKRPSASRRHVRGRASPHIACSRLAYAESRNEAVGARR